MSRVILLLTSLVVSFACGGNGAAGLEGRWRRADTLAGAQITQEVTFATGGVGTTISSGSYPVQAGAVLSGCQISTSGSFRWSTSANRLTIESQASSTVFSGCADPARNQTVASPASTATVSFTISGDSLTIIPDPVDGGVGPDSGIPSQYVYTRVS